MNALSNIDIAIEFVSKQVDPGGGGTVTPAAQTGDFAVFALIALILICSLSFCLIRLSRNFSLINTTEGKHENNNITFSGRRFTIKVLAIVAILAFLVTLFGLGVTKAIATSNSANGLIVKPDKIQIEIDEETGQPNIASFQFINDSTDNFLFDRSVMSIHEESSSLTTPADWDIKLESSSEIIFEGHPDKTLPYEIENIETLDAGKTMDVTMSFSNFNYDLAKQLIGKKVFSLSLYYNDKVVFTPTAKSNLVYNANEQTGVDAGTGYTLEGQITETNAGSYNAVAKLAEGYDCWEDGTTGDKTIAWTIEKSKINNIKVNGKTKKVPFRSGVSYTFPSAEDVAYTLEATMDPGYVDIFNESDVTLVPAIIPISKTDIGTYPLGLDTSTYTWTYSNSNVEFDNDSSWTIDDAVLEITDDPIQIDVPEAKDSLTYTGSPQTGVEAGTGYTLSGNVTETNANENYIAIATLDPDYIWSDGTRDPKQIPWKIAKAQGEFSTFPAAVPNLIYSGNSMAIITAGASSYGAKVEYKVDDEETYSDVIPSKIFAGKYTVYAHVIADDNHEQSADFAINNISIEKAVLASISIEGAKATETLEIGKKYVFPDFTGPNPQSAYTVTGYVVEQGTPLVFKTEKVTPSPIDPSKYTQIIIERAQQSDAGTYEFVLPQVSEWKYNDDNVIVKDGAWSIVNGSFTLNLSEFVDISASSSLSTAKINEALTYTVSITNKMTTAITAAKLWFGSQELTDTVDIAVGATKNVSLPYTVLGTDFLYYPTMTKVFTLKYQDFSEQTTCDVTLQYTLIQSPQLFNGFYDGEPHNFPSNVGYSFLTGDTSSKNAGVYSAWVVRNPGYAWENWPFDVYVYTWEIKKINVNVHFQLPQGKTNFEATFGDDWKVEDQTIVGTSSDVDELPDNLSTILGGDPTRLCSYEQWSKADIYSVLINLPAPSNAWSPNYNITKTDTYLNVIKKDISITWIKTEFDHTGQVISIPYTINGNIEGQHAASIVYNTYSDQARQYPKEFKDAGDYYVSAKLAGDSDSVNYNITAGALPTDIFKINAPGPVLEAKAVLTEPFFEYPQTLTLVYNDKEYIVGKDHVIGVYDIINTSYSTSPLETIFPEWYDKADTIHKVVIDPSFKRCNKCSHSETPLNSLDLWFDNMTNLSSVEGLDNIKTGNIISFNYLFHNCTSLTSLDIYTFKVQKSSACRCLFKGCNNLASINVSGNDDWTDIPKANSQEMFEGCVNLPNYSEAGLDKDSTYAKVGDGGFFNSADLGLGYAALEGGTLMFYTDKDTDMPEKQFDVPINNKSQGGVPWDDVRSNVKNVTFSDSFGIWSTKIKSTSYWFVLCSIVTLNFGENFDTSNITDMSVMFGDCYYLTTLNFCNNFDSSNVTTMRSMFLSCKMLTILNLGDNFNTSNVTDMERMFYQCNELTTLDLREKFNTSSVVNMKHMFASCYKLTTLNLGDKFNTSNVINMDSMFDGCYALSALNLGDNFNTTNVATMQAMFSGCQTLAILNLGNNFNTSNVTNMRSMFASCYKLTTLNLGDKFNTLNVINMFSMFFQCESLVTLDLGENFYTSNVENTSNMFCRCKALISLNLGENFYPSKVDGMSSMFRTCENLTYIYCKSETDWSKMAPQSCNSEYMFDGCSKLPGWNKDNPNDVRNAHDSTSPSANVGYFTALASNDDNFFTSLLNAINTIIKI